MNTRKLLSGAAALALLCSAGGCGQNESEQTHAEVQQNSGTSDISTTDAPVSTEPAGTTGTSSVATTDVSTTSVPGTQPQFCVTTNPPVSTCEPQDNSHTEQAQTKPDPSANWQEALAAEIETWGGETFRTGLGTTTFRGTTYGFKQRAISETTYEFIFFSVDPDNRGSILQRWTASRPKNGLYWRYSMYACNGRFYLYSKVRKNQYGYVVHAIDLYDTSGTLIQACTLPQFSPWHDQVPDDGGGVPSDFITVCGNGSILIRQYQTTDAYDRLHFYYLLDPETGKQTALPPPYEGAFGFFQCGNPVYPLEVDGVYQNKLYVTCTDDCKQKTGYWYDLNAGVWHALDVDLNDSANYAYSANYAIGRFLFTKGRVYDMKTDQLLSGLPESAAPLDPNKLLDPNRTLTVNDTGVYLQQDDGSNTAILEWD